MSALPQLPRGFPEPKSTGVTVATRWDKFLGEVAVGTPLAEAMLKLGVTRADIDAHARMNDVEAQRWRDAQISGRKRTWSVMQLEDIFAKIAEGMTVADAQVAVMGRADSGFTQLVIADPELYTLYRRALEARALIVMEEIFEIADDDTRDTIEGPKGTIPNMAAVGRDKLRAETRMRVAGMWNTKLYGEKREAVQVNLQINHAEVLEKARSRETLRDKRITPRKLQEAVDATFSETKPAADTDTSWMDEPTTIVEGEEK